MKGLFFLLLICAAAASPPPARAHFLQALRTGTIDYQDAAKYTLKADASFTEFSYRGVRGDYGKYLLQGEARLGRRTVLGAALPVIELESTAGNHTGLSNPALYGDRVLFSENQLFLGAGLEIGLPSPGEDEGLGSGHPEFLPALTLAKTRIDGGWEYYGVANAGFHLSAGGGKHEERSVPLLVSPHEDTEFFFTLGAGVLIDRLHLTPELSLSGEQAMEGTDAGRTFWSLAFYAPYELDSMSGEDGAPPPPKDWKPGDPPLKFERSWRWEAAPYVRVPLGRPRRFLWSAGFNLSARF